MYPDLHLTKGCRLEEIGVSNYLRKCAEQGGPVPCAGLLELPGGDGAGCATPTAGTIFRSRHNCNDSEAQLLPAGHLAIRYLKVALRRAPIALIRQLRVQKATL
jgi:hypothetical protein